RYERQRPAGDERSVDRQKTHLLGKQRTGDPPHSGRLTAWRPVADRAGRVGGVAAPLRRPIHLSDREMALVLMSCRSFVWRPPNTDPISTPPVVALHCPGTVWGLSRISDA